MLPLKVMTKRYYEYRIRNVRKLQRKVIANAKTTYKTVLKLCSGEARLYAPHPRSPHKVYAVNALESNYQDIL